MKLGAAAGLGAAALGATGFAAGFFGPIALNPEANQGPLVGILITGPGGAVLGALVGVILSVLDLPKPRVIAALASIAALGAAAILFFCLPAPQYRGNVVEIEVTDCVAPITLREQAFAYWERRLAAAPRVRPRDGWKDGFLSMVAGDPGVVVTVKTLHSAGVYENRKPWNKGTLRSGKAWWPRARYFARGATCASLAGKPGVYAPRGETARDWPAEKLSVFLNLSVLEAATPEQAALLP